MKPFEIAYLVLMGLGVALIYLDYKQRKELYQLPKKAGDCGCGGHDEIPNDSIDSAEATAML